MGWIILVALMAVVGGALWFLGRWFKNSDNADDQRVGNIMRWAVLVPVVVVSASTFAFSFYQIPAGSVGVVYSFGAIRGQIEEGPQFIAPWRKVITQSIKVERHVFERLESFSQETQDVFVKATLNIRVSPLTVQELHRTVGPEYFDVLVAPRVAQNFKDEIVKFKSVDIAPNREIIRHSVAERLKKELSPYSIEIVDLLLDNVDFRPEFKAAIEAKQIATQRALEEEQKVSMERYKAEQAVERAKGEGNAILAVAEKQAEANSKLAASLTPELVQYALIQKLAEKIQVMILPNGQNFILDPSMLKKQDK